MKVAFWTTLSGPRPTCRSGRQTTWKGSALWVVICVLALAPMAQAQDDIDERWAMYEQFTEVDWAQYEDEEAGE